MQRHCDSGSIDCVPTTAELHCTTHMPTLGLLPHQRGWCCHSFSKNISSAYNDNIEKNALSRKFWVLEASTSSQSMLICSAVHEGPSCVWPPSHINKVNDTTADSTTPALHTIEIVYLYIVSAEAFKSVSTKCVAFGLSVFLYHSWQWWGFVVFCGVVSPVNLVLPSDTAWMPLPAAHGHQWPD